MCLKDDCHKSVGKWVRFQTQWGTHRGIISEVNHQAVLMRVPRQYAPVGLASESQACDAGDEQKLDLALAQWGGYGRGWYGGWWWWWLPFAWIFWLAFLW